MIFMNWIWNKKRFFDLKKKIIIIISAERIVVISGVVFCIALNFSCFFFGHDYRFSLESFMLSFFFILGIIKLVLYSLFLIYFTSTAIFNLLLYIVLNYIGNCGNMTFTSDGAHYFSFLCLISSRNLHVFVTFVPV